MEEECPPCKKGAPEWMVTFSDLMTLLLTFFVLLLSMSSTSEPKYEKAAESLKQAFSGNYIIGSPTKDIVVIDVLDPANQKTKIDEADTENEPIDAHSQTKSYDSPSATKTESESKETEKYKKEMAQIVEDVVQDNIQKEVDKGIAEVENQQDRVLIRFPAEATFEPGSAEIKKQMRPVFYKLAESLKGLDLKAVINGHTDDIPMRSALYRSNWDLSSARAGSIAMIFEDKGEFQNSNLEVIGHAAGQPLVPNDTRENREKNRRIELFIEARDPKFNEGIFQEVINETLPADTIKKDSLILKKTQKKDSNKVDLKDKSKLDEILDKIRNFNK